MNKSPNRQQVKILSLALTIIGLLSFAGCAAYHDRVAPILLPDAETGTVVNGLKIAALAFTDPQKARDSFGFDAHQAGLLPVQITLQNDSNDTVIVNPEQTFLIDLNNKAWPILSLEKTYQRTKRFVELGEVARGTAKPALLLGAAGAIAGAAITIVTGQNIGEGLGKGATIGAAAGAIMGGGEAHMITSERIRDDILDKRLRNSAVLPQQIAHGVLFFPGTPNEEAHGARELRLALTFGDTRQIVTINLLTGQSEEGTHK